MSSRVVPAARARQSAPSSSEGGASSSTANNTNEKKQSGGDGSNSAVNGGWNDRFAYGGEPGVLKQKALPKPPFPLTGMNGGEIKSSMRHLGGKRSGQHNQHQRRKRAVDMATQTDDGDVSNGEAGGEEFQPTGIDDVMGRHSTASIPSFRMSSLKIDVTESVQCGNDGQHSKKDAHEMEGIIKRGLDGTISAAYPLCRLELLGRGSSACVYKAVLLNSLTLCAEKVVAVADYSKRAQLLRELQSFKKTLVDKDGRTKCANVVSLLDIVPNPKDGTLSICLEYMDSGSLQDLVKTGLRQSEHVIQGIAKQMLQGLQFLHSLRLIHRDLKPSNALISSAGVVKLADFGLARTLDSGASLAESFCGTFDYMAPERMIGNAYSFHSDVWSLGLTVHTVAIGAYPYEVQKGGFWAILNAVQEQPIPLPPESEFSTDFADFISKACARDPADRPTALQLLNHPFILSSPAGPINHLEIARKQPTGVKEAESSGARGRRVAPGKAGGVTGSGSGSGSGNGSYGAGVGSGIAGGGRGATEQRGRRMNMGPRGSRIPVVVVPGSRVVRVSRSGDAKGSSTDSTVNRSRPRHLTAPGLLRPPIPSLHAQPKQSSPQLHRSRSRSSSLTRGRATSLTRNREDSSVSREPSLTRGSSVSFAVTGGGDGAGGGEGEGGRDRLRKPPLPSAAVGGGSGLRRGRSRSRSQSNSRAPLASSVAHNSSSSSSSSSSSKTARGSLGRGSVSDSSGDESNNVRQRGNRFPRRNQTSVPATGAGASTAGGVHEASHVTPAEAQHIAQTWRDYAAAVSSSAVGRDGTTFTIREELSPALRGAVTGGLSLHPQGAFPTISPVAIDALARQMCGVDVGSVGSVGEPLVGESVAVAKVLRKAFAVAVSDLKEALSRAVMSEEVYEDDEEEEEEKDASKHPQRRSVERGEGGSEMEGKEELYASDFECENEGNSVLHIQKEEGPPRGAGVKITSGAAGTTKSRSSGTAFFLTTGTDDDGDEMEGEVAEDGEGEGERCASVPPAEVDDDEEEGKVASTGGPLRRTSSSTASCSASRSVSRSVSRSRSVSPVELPEGDEDCEVDEDTSIPPTGPLDSANNSCILSRIPSMLSAYSASGASANGMDTDGRAISRGSMLSSVSDLDAGKENHLYYNGISVAPSPEMFVGALPPPTDEEADEEEDYTRYRRDNRNDSSRLSITGMSSGFVSGASGSGSSNGNGSGGSGNGSGGTGGGTGGGASRGQSNSSPTSPIGIAIVKSGASRHHRASSPKTRVAAAPGAKNSGIVSAAAAALSASSSTSLAPMRTTAVGGATHGAGYSQSSTKLASSTSSLSLSSASQKFKPIAHREKISSAHGSEDEYGSDFED